MITDIVWIEMNRAKVFRVKSIGMKARSFRRHEMKHHTSRDPKNHKDCEKFFHDLAASIQDTDEILLVGPSLTKRHFLAHLKRHHHDGLAKKVVGEKTLDIMSDAKLLAECREFFKAYDLFGQAWA